MYIVYSQTCRQSTQTHKISLEVSSSAGSSMLPVDLLTIYIHVHLHLSIGNCIPKNPNRTNSIYHSTVNITAISVGNKAYP